jgi:hypothetical protein
MGCGILIRSRSVSGSCQVCTTQDYASAYRYLSAIACFVSCRKSLAHPALVLIHFSRSSHTETFTSNNGKLNYRWRAQTLSSECFAQNIFVT